MLLRLSERFPSETNGEANEKLICTFIHTIASLVGLLSQPFNDLSLNVFLPEYIASNFFERLINGLHAGAHVYVSEELLHFFIFELGRKITGRLTYYLVHRERTLAEQIENRIPVLPNELPDQRSSDHVPRHVDDHLCGVLRLDLVLVQRVGQKLIQQPRISRLT